MYVAYAHTNTITITHGKYKQKNLYAWCIFSLESLKKPNVVGPYIYLYLYLYLYVHTYICMVMYAVYIYSHQL